MMHLDIALGVHLLGLPWLTARVQGTLRRQLDAQRVGRHVLPVSQAAIDQMAIDVVTGSVGKALDDG